jgi:integrase
VAHVRRVDRAKPWVVSWRVHGKYRSKSFARKADAEAFEASIEDATRNRGILIDPHDGRITVKDWSEEWLRIAGADLKPKTVAGYRSLLRSRIIPTFGRYPIADVGAGDVDAWIADMKFDGLSPSRVRQAHVVLSAMLDLAVRHDRITRNVARGADLPQLRPREAPYFEPATVDRIIAAAPEPYRPFVAVQGVLGLRFGEAAALRRRCVDLLHRRLHVAESLAEISGELVFGKTKTHADRQVPVPPSVLHMLGAHLERAAHDPDALLFTSSRGFPLRYSRFRPTVWVPLLDRLRLPRCGVHTLRHSAAARMIAGVHRGYRAFRRPARGRAKRLPDLRFPLAPGVGLEPTTYGLTVRRSAS